MPRCCESYGRGNGALRKVGGSCEGVLRQSFLRNGEYLDQNLKRNAVNSRKERTQGTSVGKRGVAQPFARARRESYSAAMNE